MHRDHCLRTRSKCDPGFTPESPTSRCLLQLSKLIHVLRRDPCAPAGTSLRPASRPLGPPHLPGRSACGLWGGWGGEGGGSRAAQALIPTGAASSGSRIKRAPAVRSMLERPGEPGARDGDVCVRPGAGEGAGERG